MSRRTRMNKAWAKKARGEFKEKKWKQELQSYWVSVSNASASGKVYTSIQPYDKKRKYHTYFHEDMAAYFDSFFKGLFL